MFHEYGNHLPISLMETRNIPLPGIDRNRKDLYVTPFFGASREYDPEEGWRRPYSRRVAAKQRLRARRRLYGHVHQEKVAQPALEVTETDED